MGVTRLERNNDSEKCNVEVNGCEVVKDDICGNVLCDVMEIVENDLATHYNGLGQSQNVEGEDVGLDSGLEESDQENEDLFTSEFGERDMEEVHHWVNSLAHENLAFHSSEYEDSEELCSLDGSDSENGHHSMVDYKVEDEKDKTWNFKIGMIFIDHKQFKKAVVGWAAEHKRTYRWIKQERTRMVAKCEEKLCQWSIRESPTTNEDAFQVKAYYPKHTCGKTFHPKLAQASWLAKRYVDKLRADPKMSVEGFQNLIKSDLKIVVKNKKAYRARKIAEEMIHGQDGAQFGILHDYAAALKEWNLGTTVSIATVGEHFQMIYICLNACKVGFLKGCRRFIGLDACFMKGMLSGQLHCAVAMDGNDNIFLIAYAIRESETKETWIWFLGNLMRDIASEEDRNFTFMSDKQKGLRNAIEEVVPGMQHRLCVWHIYANFKKKFTGKALKDVMWQACKATTWTEHTKLMERLNELNPDAVNYMLEQNPETWARHCFSEELKCDTLLNNICECFNAWILPARDKAIVTCLETIRTQIMRRFQQKRDGLKNYIGDICPRIQKKLDKLKFQSMDAKVISNGHGLYEVEQSLEVRNVVNLMSRQCSCRKWQLTGIPCLHACSVILTVFDGRNGAVEEYVHPYYTKYTFLQAYNEAVHPMPGSNEWKRTTLPKILPPYFKVQRGRPKKMLRVGEEGEVNPNKIGRIGTKMKCGNCGGDNHNARTCKGEPNEARKVRLKAAADRMAAKRKKLKEQQVPGGEGPYVVDICRKGKGRAKGFGKCVVSKGRGGGIGVEIEGRGSGIGRSGNGVVSKVRGGGMDVASEGVEVVLAGVEQMKGEVVVGISCHSRGHVMVLIPVSWKTIKTTTTILS